MKKEELIRMFFSKGALLSPEALEHLQAFSEKEIQDILIKNTETVLLKAHITGIKRYEILKTLEKKDHIDEAKYLNMRFVILRSGLHETFIAKKYFQGKLLLRFINCLYVFIKNI